MSVPKTPVRLVAEWQGIARALGDAPHAAALDLCAEQLTAWINHEGAHMLMCMPPEFIYLLHVALHFDSSSTDSWNELGAAAEACTGDTQ